MFEKCGEDAAKFAALCSRAQLEFHCEDFLTLKEHVERILPPSAQHVLSKADEGLDMLLLGN